MNTNIFGKKEYIVKKEIEETLVQNSNSNSSIYLNKRVSPIDLIDRRHSDGIYEITLRESEKLVSRYKD